MNTLPGPQVLISGRLCRTAHDGSPPSGVSLQLVLNIGSEFTTTHVYVYVVLSPRHISSVGGEND